MEFYGEPFVINPKQVEQGSVQVVDMDDVFNGVVAKFVGSTVSEPAFDPAAAQEH